MDPGEDEFSSDEDGFQDDRAAPDDEHEFEEEDEDSFDGAYGGHGGHMGGAQSPQGAEGVVSNQPYDEAMELSDDGDQASPSGGGGGEVERMEFGASKQGESGIISNQHHDEAEDCSSEESVDDDEEADEASASMGYSAEPSPAVQERPQPRSQAPAALAAKLGIK